MQTFYKHLGPTCPTARHGSRGSCECCGSSRTEVAECLGYEIQLCWMGLESENGEKVDIFGLWGGLMQDDWWFMKSTDNGWSASWLWKLFTLVYMHDFKYIRLSTDGGDVKWHRMKLALLFLDVQGWVKYQSARRALQWTWNSFKSWKTHSKRPQKQLQGDHSRFPCDMLAPF